MADGIVKAFKEGQIDQQNVSSAVLDIAKVVEKEGDGTSGALYNIFTNALAAGVTTSAVQQKSDKATAAVWAGAFDYALTALYQYTAARRPSRTLVDPLGAFVKSFSASKGADFASAVKEAVQAANETKDLVAKAGRAAYGMLAYCHFPGKEADLLTRLSRTGRSEEAADSRSWSVWSRKAARRCSERHRLNWERI
jgi:dihydroxyacetone kinase